ncbi:MAG: patatin-like phospholipase family protein [Burkholderiaceae bacterium]
MAGLPDGAWAIALSSGGPRGFVHVGVLRALDEIGVRPDLVVGASVGALVGALYCGGVDTGELTKIALDLEPWSMASFSIGTDERYSGAPIARLLGEHLRERQLERMRPRCGIVALDLRDRRPVVFTRGDAAVAVQASTAIESRFAPVRIHGRDYGDPDKVMPMPVRIARELGARYVMSVDASAHEDQAPPGAERFRDTDRLKRELTLPDSRTADVALHPDFGYWVSLSKAFRETAMEAGYRATMARHEEIIALARRSRATESRG